MTVRLDDVEAAAVEVAPWTNHYPHEVYAEAAARVIARGGKWVSAHEALHGRPSPPRSLADVVAFARQPSFGPPPLCRGDR